MRPKDESCQAWDRSDAATQCFFHEWFDIPFPFQMREESVISNIDAMLTQPQVFPDGKLLRVRVTKSVAQEQKIKRNTIPDLSEPSLYAIPSRVQQDWHDPPRTQPRLNVPVPPSVSEASKSHQISKSTFQRAKQ